MEIVRANDLVIKYILDKLRLIDELVLRKRWRLANYMLDSLIAFIPYTFRKQINNENIEQIVLDKIKWIGEKVKMMAFRRTEVETIRSID